MDTPSPTQRGDFAKAWIRRAYQRLEAQSGMTTREAQHELSELVAESLIHGRPLAAEAPTGTGKTLAYLVGALGARQETGVSIAVSTATKALQQQLLSTDLPRLVAAGLVAGDAVGLAKGRGNYLCLRDARDVTQGLLLAGNDGEAYLDDAMVELSPEEVEPLLSAFDSGRWKGDFDLYDGVRPRSVVRIAASSDNCSGNKCEHYKQCPYYAARKELTGSDIVVANHDLTLIDLTMSAEGAEGTLPLASYYAIFDEAHHLPEKAISAGSAEVSTKNLAAFLTRLPGVGKGLEGLPVLAEIARRKFSVTAAAFNPLDARLAFTALKKELDELETSKEYPSVRFPGGAFHGALEVAFGKMLDEGVKLFLSLSALNDLLKEGLTAYPELGSDANTRKKFTDLSNRVRDTLRVAKALNKLGDLLRRPIRRALWVYKPDDNAVISGAPLEGADVLEKLLWKSDRVKAVALVSATLRDIKGFERFRGRVGLPATAVCRAMPYTFAYKESTLTVAGMSATPKPQERPAFVRELGQKLPQYVNPNEGTLLLYPSWALLREMTPVLQRLFGDRLRIQGETPVRALVRGHCNAIDQGRGAVLAGVATLAEGLDLPGNYCTHVVVIALPFAAPNDPVEEELAELLGKDYFSRRSLPDAMIRLTQMVGRLLRREADRGRVTVFDKRLGATSYGRQMLDALPPFNKVVERPA